jgi:hypothetical protein
MSNKKIYSVGTAVYYGGDDSNDGGFGTITAQYENYMGELALEITIADGRKIFDVTPGDFQARTVLGNTSIPEFYLADGDVISELDRYNLDEADTEEWRFASLY